MRLNHYKKSFTIIEILISLIIISIFSIFSLSSYRRFSEEKKLETTTDHIIATIELAKKKAMSGDTKDFKNCPLGNSFGYATVISYNILKLLLCCDQLCENNYLISKYLLPANIVVNSTEDILTKFMMVSGNVITNYQSFRVYNEKIGRCYEVTISPIGVINKNENCL